MLSHQAPTRMVIAVGCNARGWKVMSSSPVPTGGYAGEMNHKWPMVAGHKRQNEDKSLWTKENGQSKKKTDISRASWRALKLNSPGFRGECVHQGLPRHGPI